MQQVISVGNQDFKSIRENNYFYIDKTSFIKEWWENGDSVTLITRPRRFGKTLNMSMVETFFSNTEKEQAKLFEDLEIWQEARKLAKEVFILSKETDLKTDFRFKEQIKASSGSVMDNIAEGFE